MVTTRQRRWRPGLSGPPFSVALVCGRGWCRSTPLACACGAGPKVALWTAPPRLSPPGLLSCNGRQDCLDALGRGTHFVPTFIGVAISICSCQRNAHRQTPAFDTPRSVLSKDRVGGRSNRLFTGPHRVASSRTMPPAKKRQGPSPASRDLPADAASAASVV